MSVDPVDQELIAHGPLRIDRRRYGRGVTVVSLLGELDHATVSNAREAIVEAGHDGEEELLVLDLSALEFIDSAGIALLVSLARPDGGGKSLRIVPSAAPGVARVMRVTGVDSMVPVVREHPARAA